MSLAYWEKSLCLLYVHRDAHAHKYERTLVGSEYVNVRKCIEWIESQQCHRPRMQCLELPCDFCCPGCFITKPGAPTKVCRYACCECFRCDNRLTVRRPFLLCVVFGFMFALLPTGMMAIMFFATYFTTTFSEGATTTNCLLVSGWAALQMVFNLMNFVFCLWCSSWSLFCSRILVSRDTGVGFPRQTEHNGSSDRPSS